VSTTPSIFVAYGSEIAGWALGLCGVLLVVIIGGAKFIANTISKVVVNKFSVIESTITSNHAEALKKIDEHTTAIYTRLNIHGERIATLEEWRRIQQIIRDNTPPPAGAD
jgi:hypothetical protein